MHTLSVHISLLASWNWEAHVSNDKPLRDATVFFVITIGLSYLVFWGPLALFRITAISFVSGEKGPVWAIVMFMIGGFVPSLTAVLLTAVKGGGTALRRLGRRAIQFRIGWSNYLSIVVLVAVAAVAQIFVNRLLGHKFEFGLFVTQLGSVLPLIIIGPISEEFGWRGYALGRLQTRFNALLSSLIVGIVWGFWHLPLFLMPGTSQQTLGIPFVGFLCGVTAVSILMTLFHNRTGGSILTAIFFHWVYTYAAQVTATGVTRSPLYNWLEFSPYVVLALAAVAIFGVRLGMDGPRRAVGGPDLPGETSPG